MIQIDACHIELIYGLVRASKPASILELGFGTGASNAAILRAIQENQKGTFDLVDNFCDWGGQRPPHFQEHGFTFHLQDETQFVLSTDRTYDFILADGDHNSTDFQILRLLKPGGILVLHDITNDMFPNLRKFLMLGGRLFNQSSQPSEQCGRGLLVFFAAS